MSKIKICLVDDHPIMLQGITMTLVDNPRFDVVATFRGGEAALAAFPSMPAFDVAVIDRVYLEGVYLCSQSLKTISADFRNPSEISLTDREREVLELLECGQSNKEIAMRKVDSSAKPEKQIGVNLPRSINS